jgi:hypothetical protein
MSLDELLKQKFKSGNNVPVSSVRVTREEYEAAAVEKSEVEKDAANLLFALIDAWPYVHEFCTIKSKKETISALMRKHGDFADLHEPVNVMLVPKDYVLVPKTLTAENGAKSALMGEFRVGIETDCQDCNDYDEDDVCETCKGEGYTIRYEDINWTTIKDIWAAGVSHFTKGS